MKCVDPRHDKDKSAPPKPIVMRADQFKKARRHSVPILDGSVILLKNALKDKKQLYADFVEFGEYMLKSGVPQHKHSFNFGVAKPHMMSNLLAFSKNYYAFEKEWRKLLQPIRREVSTHYNKLSIPGCWTDLSPGVPQMFGDMPYNGWQLNYGHAGHLHRDRTVNAFVPTVIAYLGTFKSSSFTYFPYCNSVKEALACKNPVKLTIKPGDVLIFDAKYYHIGRSDGHSHDMPKEAEKAKYMHDDDNVNRISVVMMCDATWNKKFLATREEKAKEMKSYGRKISQASKRRSELGMLGKHVTCTTPSGKVLTDADMYSFTQKGKCMRTATQAMKSHPHGHTMRSAVIKNRSKS